MRRKNQEMTSNDELEKELRKIIAVASFSPVARSHYEIYQIKACRTIKRGPSWHSYSVFLVYRY
jgi:hypothetical protein